MKNSDLNKAIKLESKELTKHLKIDEHNELTYRISPVKVKSSMEKSLIKEHPIHEFTPEFEAYLINFRKYLVEDVKKLKIEFDPKTGKREQNQFKKTWNDYFAHEIVFESKTIQKLKRRILISIFGGFVLLSLCVLFALLVFFFETKQGLQITYIILNNLLFTLSWVFIWQGVSFLVYEYNPRKKKRKNLYIMYKAAFVVGQSYSKYKKEKKKHTINILDMEKQI